MTNRLIGPALAVGASGGLVVICTVEAGLDCAHH